MKKHVPRKKVPKPTIQFEVDKPLEPINCPICKHLIEDCICFEQDV